MPERNANPSVTQSDGRTFDLFDFSLDRVLRLLILAALLFLLLFVERSRNRQVVERDCID